MSGRDRSVIRVQTEPFDAAAEAARLARAGDIGAVVTFTGLCRDENGRLAGLDLEHYPGMAEAEITRVVAQAQGRWPVAAVTVIHRFGRVAPGDEIVFVGVAATHRGPAFAAAEFLMDYLKTKAPFWKRERLADGSAAGWVAATEADEAATARWQSSA